MAKWLALHYFHQNWGTNVICCVYGIGNEDSFCMSPTHNLTPNYEEKLAKTMVGLSLVRSFGGHYTAARMASNAGIIFAGYAIGGTNGLLVAAGAELVNQTLRSTYARGATLATQESFIDQHWNTLSKLPAVQWAVARLHDQKGLEQAASRPVPLPSGIEKDFRRTAYELGVRQSTIGPVYDLGRWVWRKFKHKPTSTNTPQ